MQQENMAPPEKQKRDAWPKVALIVLNWEAWRDTAECLDSLRKITYPNAEIVVVDNGSSDKSEEMLKERFPDLPILQTGKNLGYTGGNNAGIRHALKHKADYVLLLNNDTLVERDFLQPLVHSLETNEKIGMVGGKILFSNAQNKISSAGGEFIWYKGLGIFIGEGETDSGQYDTPREVDFLTGCFWLVQASVFTQLGLLDERYFIYVEDVEFCYRVRQAGWKILYQPQSVIYHTLGQAFEETKPFIRHYYRDRNRILFTRENMPWLRRWGFYLFFFPSRLVLVGKYLIVGEVRVVRAILQGIVHGLLGKTGIAR